MGPKSFAVLAAVQALNTVRFFQAGDYLFGTLGICVVAAATFRAYRHREREPT
jgi:hypothetical protein